jgi:hypothetical protein
MQALQWLFTTSRHLLLKEVTYLLMFGWHRFPKATYLYNIFLSFPFCGFSHSHGVIICTVHSTEHCLSYAWGHVKFTQNFPHKSFKWRNHFTDIGIDGGVMPTSPRKRGFKSPAPSELMAGF